MASSEDDTESALRGLDDEDAEVERPAIFPASGKRAATSLRLKFPDNLKRDKTRQNEVSTYSRRLFPPNVWTDIFWQLVGINIDSADDLDDIMILKVIILCYDFDTNNNTFKFLKAKPKGKSKAAPEKTTATKAKAKQAKVKEEGDVIHQTEIKAPKMDNLLRDPRWTNVFLPSLAHALYVSRKPFKHFKTKAPEFLQVIQEIFNLSYPEIDLALRSKDELVQKVRAMSHTIHHTD